MRLELDKKNKFYLGWNECQAELDGVLQLQGFKDFEALKRHFEGDGAHLALATDMIIEKIEDVYELVEKVNSGSRASVQRFEKIPCNPLVEFVFVELE